MELSDSVHFVTGGSAAHAVAGWIERNGAGTLTELHDPLSCGPLDGFGTPEGMERRRGWIEQVCETLGERELWSFIEPYIGLPQLKRQLDNYTSCVIWCGHQTDEQLLLRAVCAAYPDRKLYLADVAAGRVKGDERCAVGACSTNDLLEVAIQPIDPLRRAELAGEWQSLIEESGLVRTFQTGTIAGHDEDFFDAALISACADTFQNAGRIVGDVLGQYPLQVGDTYLAYRLHLLIRSGILTAEGGPELYRMHVRRNGE
ncbi:DUF3658 domain-containing protein [Ruegeria sp. HKCCD8929]|uniref:DUF3658 domain-containing protein n=1 Tax=Ruegeria sp. HKCCD8929 TaxID=2683006 RepID=UPI001488610E|nr:DUF3658 domain-containing protein [Ruegeria sp. HKCCD8929]